MSDVTSMERNIHHRASSCGVSFLAGFVDITADPDYDVDINTGAHLITFSRRN